MFVAHKPHIAPLQPAAGLIARFGNAYKLSRFLTQLAEHTGDNTVRRAAAVIYRWTYSRERGGTGGVVPTSAMQAIKDAARLEGIMLTAEDFYDTGR